MRRSTAFGLAVLVLLVPVGIWSCVGAGEAVAEGGKVISAIGAALPPPWGILLSAVGTVATLAAGHFTDKSKQATLAAGGQPSPLVKMFAERKWLLPIVGGLVTGMRAGGILPISDTDLYAILTMIGIPTAGEFVKDALANRAPEAVVMPVAPTSTAPPAS